ncbi:copper resistance protein NlpE N-terminal domain-containing protein [Pontibacter anaerobius]|uniref:Copper resistance protein NlpE N-terminal domain-containing protein n=1 Tax=Pontibacter anaerobius TaxID=2993940 RepID=A0ABT3REK0_9BACT|nr:copper resistance protein NlpE N-terminal domain-containing protein [Pontibacter anaerobius]MCX2740264.1 copper resistance protein NlpE N-terminal domain-containing protein [Pontibacter anaerobius]
MKTIITFFVLFTLTLGLQQAQAQSGKSYKEWLEESRKVSNKATSKKATAKGKATAAKAEDKAPAPVMAPPSGTFRGIMACADCKGIRTELILTGGPKDLNRTFTMKQMYVGKPDDKSVVSGSGKWILAKGNKQDPDAVILQLIPMEGDLNLMYFQQVSETEVKLLNNRQEEISDSKNYSLRKL